MKIQVTQDDIDKGEIENPNTCAIARAVKRETHRRHVGIYEDNGIEIEKDHYKMPWTKTIRNFIDRFDKGEKVRPFSFELKGYRRV